MGRLLPVALGNGAAPNTNTAVLWACVPYLDANSAVSAGRLLAYDATAFGTFADSSKQLRALWDNRTGTLLSASASSPRRSSLMASSMYRTYDARADVYGLA